MSKKLWPGSVFPEGCSAPPNVKLIPTQPIMAAGNFVFFIIITAYYLSSCPKKGSEEAPKRKYVPGVAFCLYLLLYSVGRFLVEFLRDDERGWVGALSTSQFIAIFTFAFGVILMYILLRGSTKRGSAESAV